MRLFSEAFGVELTLGLRSLPKFARHWGRSAQKQILNTGAQLKCLQPRCRGLTKQSANCSFVRITDDGF